MSAFREILEALRILRPHGLSSADRPLASDPGPALLRWELAQCVPVSWTGPHDTRQQIMGEFYGRSFSVWFPGREVQPAGHTWVLACWPAKTSGTHRPEVQAACRTCTDELLDHLEPRTIVGPAMCVLRAAEDRP